METRAWAWGAMELSSLSGTGLGHGLGVLGALMIRIGFRGVL